MASNSMSIRLLYETGSQEIITAPDLSVQEGFAFQSEVVDVSDPDKGIWWYRNFIPLTEPDREDEDGSERNTDPWREFQHGTCVVPPSSMPHILTVIVGGIASLVRSPQAESECGLMNPADVTDEDTGGQDGTAASTDEGDLYEDPSID